MQPVIGLSCSLEEDEGVFMLSADYVKSIEEAGGIPVIIPSWGEENIDHVLGICAGLVFSGGGDIDPAHWDEAPAPGLGQIDPQRDRFELSLARRAFELRVPALGICRGCQVMNVAAGGTLIQDLASFLCHQQNAPRHYPFHDIVVKEGSLLYHVLGAPAIKVNSFHHQAVKAVGRGLIICAWAQDGNVEAICSGEHPFWLGVQWHPECMLDGASLRLFESLVKSCFR